MNSRQLDEEAVFHTARLIDNPEGRERYLDQICAGDQALRERVEALLDVHEQEQEFLKSSPEPVPTVDQPPISEGPGHQIGRYKLLQKIGEGGFGVVYMAEQVRPVRRKVALKIIKPGMDTHAIVARFEAERQALALMDHPNISRVLDGGATESGRPYFVMELVKGISITEYCDKNNLSTQDRIRLFVSVCHAVQHAHQKGIIHRDLKPSNVLVTLHDGQPVVKVIDFGISKAINQRLTEKTLFTAFGQMVGTPQYMSPEQAEMSGLDVDTRSDVYSLGIVLYELLTGVTPLDPESIRDAGCAEMLRIIRETEPPKPSTRLSKNQSVSTDIARQRGSTPERLHKLIRGDLDWIVMTAIEKDRTRRYDTAASLAEDLRRFCSNELIQAHPPTTLYRIHKTLQRNKTFVATCLTILVALISVTFSLAMYLREAEKRASDADNARTQLAKTLKDVEEESFANALHAALVGDQERTNNALTAFERAAKHDPSMSARKAMVEGLLHFSRGEYAHATVDCRAALIAHPHNLIAQAILAKAYIHAGQDDRFPSELQKLRKLGKPQSDEEKLLVAAVEIMNDPRVALKILDEVGARQRSPLKLALKAEATLHLASEKDDPKLCHDALAMFENVEYLLGPAQNTMTYQILAVVLSMKYARRADCLEDVTRLTNDGERIAKILREKYPEAIGARFCRWCFQCAKVNPQAAWDVLQSTQKFDDSYAFILAIDRLRHEHKPDKALSDFDSVIREDARAGNRYARLARAHLVVAAQHHEETTRELLEEFLRPEIPVLVRKHAIYLLGLSGDHEGMEEEARLLLQTATDTDCFEKDGEHVVLEFLADSGMTEETLLETAGSSGVRQCTAHFAIGVRRLSIGNRSEAAKAFEKCVETPAIAYFEHEFAQAYLALLRRHLKIED